MQYKNACTGKLGSSHYSTSGQVRHGPWVLLSAPSSVQHHGRQGIEIFHIRMGHQDLVNFQSLLRVREDLKKGFPQLVGFCRRPLCWQGQALCDAGKVRHEREAGLLRKPVAGRGALTPGWRLVAGAGGLCARASEAGVEHAHWWQGIEGLHISGGAREPGELGERHQQALLQCLLLTGAPSVLTAAGGDAGACGTSRDTSSRGPERAKSSVTDPRATGELPQRCRTGSY